MFRQHAKNPISSQGVEIVLIKEKDGGFDAQYAPAHQ